MFTAGYFDIGYIEWQVRTKSSGGVISDWSNTAQFDIDNYPNTPIFTTDSSYPIANPVVSWEVSNQTAYEFILFSENGEELWSVTRNTQEQTLEIEYDLSNDTYYELHVSVRNESGAWSGYGITTIYIDYTEPPNVRIDIIPDSANASVFIQVVPFGSTGTEPDIIYNEVFRRESDSRWIMILEGMPAEFDYRDYALASNKVYEYRVRCHADNGTYTDTFHAPDPLKLTGIWLHDPDDPQRSMIHFKTFQPGRTRERTYLGEMMFFEGRSGG
ncbi:hypothetical protein [Geomicrobium sp. JCM 19038]|uniref:hypothetical protein n=1 Tax=Geomicrobium sp. JCM 19038 TaxID=1460635 RepID=UPI00045F1EAA|nr:hypothetical protein [Geomicrobium sp. JCM 19038]GAK09008.1 hypothetical protein JCM19038_2818 [Geomicrobium sp. JCM 19038]